MVDGLAPTLRRSLGLGFRQLGSEVIIRTAQANQLVRSPPQQKGCIARHYIAAGSIVAVVCLNEPGQCGKFANDKLQFGPPRLTR